MINEVNFGGFPYSGNRTPAKNDRWPSDRPEALERLRRVIIELLAADQLQNVSMREIIRRGQVSPNTIYKYFGSKEQLFLACISPDLHQLKTDTLAIAHSDQSTWSKIEKSLSLFFLLLWRAPRNWQNRIPEYSSD